MLGLNVDCFKNNVHYRKLIVAISIQVSIKRTSNFSLTTRVRSFFFFCYSSDPATYVFGCTYVFRSAGRL